MELLASHLAQSAASVAFPELANVPTVELRRFMKRCRAERYRSAAKALVAALEANAAHVSGLRARADISPRNAAAAQDWLGDTEVSRAEPIRCS
jgi:nucleolar complex protein 2